MEQLREFIAVGMLAGGEEVATQQVQLECHCGVWDVEPHMVWFVGTQLHIGAGPCSPLADRALN